MRFIDEVKIQIKAGDGGNGCVSFFRGPHLPKGGPDGGDGGRGGSIYFVGSSHLHSLLDFKYQPLFRAERGQDGRGRQCNGRSGKDLYVHLPLGTQVKNLDGDVLVDITEVDQEVLVAKGGRGGRGNINFKSSTQQAPRTATPGEIGEEFDIRLELKCLSDVGLVGLPNAGKSSLLKALSSAQPKVAAYPFTTLRPNLGVVELGHRRFMMADIPGLIEGASENLGLGHQFLRHIVRSRILLILLSFDEDISLQKQLEILRKELEAYDASLLEKQQLVVVNKLDLISDLGLETKVRAKFDRQRKLIQTHCPKSLFVSALHQTGVQSLLHSLEEELSISKALVLSCA